MEITFYFARRTRSAIVHWMLEELGEPYRVHQLDMEAGEHKAADYLAVNPMGKVPALAHGPVVVTEAAAICCYLADAFPAAGLAPAADDALRGPYLKWLFFGPGCMEPAMIDRMLGRDVPPPHVCGYGSFEQMLGAVTSAVAPGPYLLGEAFTAADVVIGSTLRWGMMTGILPERAEIAAYARRLGERPALRRTTAREDEFAKLTKHATNQA